MFLCEAYILTVIPDVENIRADCQVGQKQEEKGIVKQC